MITTQRQREDSSRYTVESVLTSLGYPIDWSRPVNMPG